jgi:hypothetical protein
VCNQTCKHACACARALYFASASLALGKLAHVRLLYCLVHIVCVLRKPWVHVLHLEHIEAMLGEGFQLFPTALHLALFGHCATKILISVVPKLCWLCELGAQLQEHVHLGMGLHDTLDPKNLCKAAY